MSSTIKSSLPTESLIDLWMPMERQMAISRSTGTQRMGIIGTLNPAGPSNGYWRVGNSNSE